MIMKCILSLFFISFIFLGCSPKAGVEYDGNTLRSIKTVIKGTVVRSGLATIADDGKGTAIGGMVGSVLGSLVGSNRYTSSLGMIGGAILGGVTGNEVMQKKVTELTVELDEGEIIVILVERDDIVVGNRIEIIQNGNRVERVNIIE